MHVRQMYTHINIYIYIYIYIYAHVFSCCFFMLPSSQIEEKRVPRQNMDSRDPSRMRLGSRAKNAQKCAWRLYGFGICFNRICNNFRYVFVYVFWTCFFVTGTLPGCLKFRRRFQNGSKRGEKYALPPLCEMCGNIGSIAF
jgi:hypothetical protein